MALKNFFSIFDVKAETVMDDGNRIQIIESKDKKLLNFNGATYSKFNKKSIYTHGFWDYFIPAAFLFEKPRVLVLGLGGGTIPYQLGTLLGNKVTLESVEISRKIADIAKKFVPKMYGKVIIRDGFDYVLRTKKKYDLIVLDVYFKSGQIPKAFLSREFVDNAHRILTSTGVLAINYAKNPYNLLRLNGYKSRLKKRFKLYEVKTSFFGDNVILLCSKKIEKEEMLEMIRRRMKPNKENSLLLRSYALMKRL